MDVNYYFIEIKLTRFISGEKQKETRKWKTQTKLKPIWTLAWALPSRGTALFNHRLCPIYWSILKRRSWIATTPPLLSELCLVPLTEKWSTSPAVSQWQSPRSLATTAQEDQNWFSTLSILKRCLSFTSRWISRRPWWAHTSLQHILTNKVWLLFSTFSICSRARLSNPHWLPQLLCFTTQNCKITN